GALGEDETLALQTTTDTGFVATILLSIGLDVVVPVIGNVLQEQHHKDVVLVLTGIDNAPEGVAGRPRRLVDLLLRELVGHFDFLSCPASGRMRFARSTRIRLVNFFRDSAAIR